MAKSNKVTLLSWIVATVTLLALLATLNTFGVITGNATDTAEANLTIQSSASITFSTSQINFGSGYVDATALYNGTLSTEGELTNVTSFTNVTQGLVLENNGNVNVSVTLVSSKAASAFIGGVLGGGPSFQWKAKNNSEDDEGGSCIGEIQNIGSYTEAVTSPVTICNNLRYEDTNDTIEIDLKLVVPKDAIGTKGTVITAEGTALP